MNYSLSGGSFISFLTDCQPSLFTRYGTVFAKKHTKVHAHEYIYIYIYANQPKAEPHAFNCSNRCCQWQHGTLAKRVYNTFAHAQKNALTVTPAMFDGTVY